MSFLRDHSSQMSLAKKAEQGASCGLRTIGRAEPACHGLWLYESVVNHQKRDDSGQNQLRMQILAGILVKIRVFRKPLKTDTTVNQIPSRMEM